MGVTYTCPPRDDDLELDINNINNSCETVLVRSFSFQDDKIRSALRSLSFNGRDLKPTQISTKMMYTGSVSFGGEMKTLVSFKSQKINMDKHESVSDAASHRKTFSLSMLRPDSPRDQAAITLQKVYKSFRTRRQLADCAVLVEQRWWKLLDFAELKHSSISFFDIEGPETALSRWCRARTRAAKVGKGLSKDEKARKLALQHWLEAIDPRHRYGHNLQFYYATWLHCQSRQPFFYWLDIGEGKEVNHERCSRQKLQQQCIKYLGPTERKVYEVVVENGKFVFKQSGMPLNTTEGPKDAKWIFVLSTSKTLYVGLKCKGTFQHSSFLAGGATLSAGRLVVEEGTLKAVWPHSGHYLPTEENFLEFMTFLEENNVDITTVEQSPTDEEDDYFNMKDKKANSDSIQHTESNKDISQETESTNAETHPQEKAESIEQDSYVPVRPLPRIARGFVSKIARVNIPPKGDIFKPEKVIHSSQEPGSPLSDGYETAEESLLSEEDFMVSKVVLFDEGEEEREEEQIPKEKIMKRIDSHKGMKSYQLGKHLSCKWTTGAGPRIGCMRDYPLELQARVLEDAHLSPRSKGNQGSPFSAARPSPRWGPTSLSKETTI
ncbi:hypothetical protein ACFE04_002292 [Oxalis oulophora]